MASVGAYILDCKTVVLFLLLARKGVKRRKHRKRGCFTVPQSVFTLVCSSKDGAHLYDQRKNETVLQSTYIREGLISGIKKPFRNDMYGIYSKNSHLDKGGVRDMRVSYPRRRGSIYAPLEDFMRRVQFS